MVNYRLISLALTASLDEAGYSTASIINLLVTEGGAA